jgi:c-di-GMP-related signal transduction protein
MQEGPLCLIDVVHLSIISELVSLWPLNRIVYTVEEATP